MTSSSSRTFLFHSCLLKREQSPCAPLCIITLRAALSLLRIKQRCDWTDGSARLYSTSNYFSDVRTLHTSSSPSPWRSRLFLPGVFLPWAVPGETPPSLRPSDPLISEWAAKMDVVNQVRLWGRKSSISWMFCSLAAVQSLWLIFRCRALKSRYCFSLIDAPTFRLQCFAFDALESKNCKELQRCKGTTERDVIGQFFPLVKLQPMWWSGPLTVQMCVGCPECCSNDI